MDEKELNLEEKVTVKNIAKWKVSFSRISDGIGDVNISPEGSIRLSRNEIIAQIQNGNKLFTGIDGEGSHATLFINDDFTRVEVDFDSKDGTKKQDVFNEKKVKDLFAIKSVGGFETQLKRSIRTRAEKYAFMATIMKLKLNDYNKIKISEDYTGYELRQFSNNRS